MPAWIALQSTAAQPALPFFWCFFYALRMRPHGTHKVRKEKRELPSKRMRGVHAKLDRNQQARRKDTTVFMPEKRRQGLPSNIPESSCPARFTFSRTASHSYDHKRSQFQCETRVTKAPKTGFLSGLIMDTPISIQYVCTT